MKNIHKEILNNRIIKTLEVYRTGTILSIGVPLKINSISRRNGMVIIGCNTLDDFIVFDEKVFREKIKGLYK